MIYYVALDIGCVECGEKTNVLGIFTTEMQAQKVIKDHQFRQEENWHGAHHFEIIEIDELDKEYKVEYK